MTFKWQWGRRSKCRCFSARPRRHRYPWQVAPLQQWSHQTVRVFSMLMPIPQQFGSMMYGIQKLEYLINWSATKSFTYRLDLCTCAYAMYDVWTYALCTWHNDDRVLFAYGKHLILISNSSNKNNLTHIWLPSLGASWGVLHCGACCIIKPL